MAPKRTLDNTAIIPVGFRCGVRGILSGQFGINGALLPFDLGFWSPESVAGIIRRQRMDFDTHIPCIKYEQYKDSKLGIGVKFQSSTYDEIDSLIMQHNSEVNKYLDSTFGYYTLIGNDKSVLAHYNWHKRSDAKLSEGCTNPAMNIKKTDSLLHRRFQRMMDICHNSSYIIFVHHKENSDFLMIDDEVYDLHDTTPIKLSIKEMFGDKAIIASLENINCINELLDS